MAGSQPVEVLLVDGANPVFAAPKAWKVREAFDKVPFIVSFASFVDETSVLADLILPDHSFLESWADALPESGSMVAVASVAAPAMKPLFQTRATPDVLLDVAQKLKKPLDLPWTDVRRDAQGDVRRVSARTPGRPRRSRAAGGASCRRSQACDRCDGSGAAAANQRRTADPTNARPVSYAEPQFDGDAGAVSVSFPAVSVAAVLRRIARASAVAAGAARSDDVGDVEQLGRDQSEDRGDA